MLTAQGIGERVLALRQAQGLSRDGVVKRLFTSGFETTMTTIRSLEAGTNDRIDVFLLSALAKAFGISLWTLIEESAPAVSASGHPLEARFSQVLTKMSPEEVEPHLEALEALAEKRAAALAKRGTKKAAG